MIKRGDSVKLQMGGYGIITSIQDVHNRYQLLGVSNWRYGIKELEKQNFESLHAEIERQAKEISNLNILTQYSPHVIEQMDELIEIQANEIKELNEILRSATK